MRECPTCHQQTPEGNFCVRCGAPLDGALEHSRARRQYAAAPGEGRYTPWLVSTLFPHLPRHSERHFRVAVISGAALVAVLGVLRLFPIALIVAALLMPLLAVLYFYDADIYEGEPAWASAWTLAWGALSGVAVGLLAKAVAPSGAALIDRGSSGHVVTGGILIPALGVVAMLAGPLVLLRYRRFNEALDGATFGAATAAAFAAAEAVVVGVGVLNGGLRPAGAAAPWVARLLGLAIATPVLSMSAIGAATAAAWLRYRSPMKDRSALGVTGIPAVAVVIAALLVIAGAVAETFMAAGVWLAWVVALDLVGLVLLRRAVHIGLLEEAAEIEIGPPIRCANCEAMTAAHTFCGNCGISLKALPKVRDATGSDEAPAERGSFRGRLSPVGGRSGRRRLALYAVAVAAIAGIAVLVAALAAPPAPKPRCKVHSQCGAPPVLAKVQMLFSGYTVWQSSGFGFSLRYNSSQWQATNQDADDLQLQAGDGFSVLLVNAVPSSSATPDQLVQARISALKGELLGLVKDTSPSDQLLGTNVGLRSGPGGVYQATVSTPQGPQAPVAIAVMAATDGNVSISVTVIAPGDNVSDKNAVYQRADDIIGSIEWAGQ